MKKVISTRDPFMIYDLNVSALRVLLRNESEADFSRTRTMAPSGAYVRCTRHDVRFREFARRARGFPEEQP